MIEHHRLLAKARHLANGNTMVAEDLVQEAHLSALLRPPQNAHMGWWATVMKNRLIDQSRSGDALNHAVMNYGDLPNVEEEREDLTPAIDLLESHYRDVCRLIFIYGYTDREAGEILGIPVGTIKSRLNRASKRLREIVCAS